MKLLCRKNSWWLYQQKYVLKGRGNDGIITKRGIALKKWQFRALSLQMNQKIRIAAFSTTSNSDDDQSSSSSYIKSKSFIEMFRSMSPYINVHRNTVIVIHLPGDLLANENSNFCLQDFSLCHTLGIQLVLVAGSRPQVNARLESKGISPQFVNGVRITSPSALDCVLDAAGFVRARLESSLSRGLANTPGNLINIHASSGNYVTAQPVGVIDGVDFEYSGRVRKIQVDKVKEALKRNDVVVMSNLGYSRSGEVFNCISEEVAVMASTQLGASKLIFFGTGDQVVKVSSGFEIQSLPLPAAKELLRHKEMHDSEDEFVMQLGYGVKACESGVQRVHIVNRMQDGALLEELFTRDGSGLMICRDMYEDVRVANTKDIVGIMKLIQPLLDAGILVTRTQEQIESRVDQFSVVERDGTILSCAALHLYEDGFAELACVAVDKSAQRTGIGNVLIAHVMRRAAEHGSRSVFVLTTRTSHWFLERGFKAATIDDLPPSKRTTIDQTRNSKVYMMDISDKRLLDEQELLFSQSLVQ